MLRAFYSGISGLRNHQQAMDVVGNNLANVNTSGYKASRTTFMDTLNQTMQGARSGSTTSGGKNAMQVGLGMTVAAIDRDVTQGALQSTGRNLDMAIQGEGWFVVGNINPQTNDDTFFYSRSGNFFVDDQANLVTSNGDFVYGWVDTDASGTVDPTRDEMKFINLDRRGDGSITNSLASSTPPVSGPNQGDATLSAIVTSATTVSDKWRVECVNAEMGTFRITGARQGVLGNYSYQNVVNEATIGNFAIDMGPPAKARLSTSFSQADGFNENFAFTNSGPAVNISFVSGGVDATGAVSVNQVGSDVTVTMSVDADGNVTSTFNQVEAALLGAIPGVTVDFTGTGDGTRPAESQQRAENLVNQLVAINAGTVATPVNAALNLGDVAPVGYLGFTANEFGAGGNKINIKMINRGAQQKQTEIAVDGSNITVYLAADSSGRVTTTANQLYTAFTQNQDASALVTMDNPAGYGNMVLQATSQLYLGEGSGANQGDYFTFTTTAPGGAKIESITVNSEGGVIGVFDNGSTEEIARVALAKVPNPQGLLAVGQGKFAETPVSGTGFPPVSAGTQGTGTIASGFLEMSNVDLAREFTEMIVNQRGFQANSRIITTSDEMLQELMQLKR